MKVPLRIYYDKLSGQVLEVTGNFEDKFLTSYETVEVQLSKYTELAKRNRDTFDVIELPFGAYAQDFAECNGYRVNPTTKALEFSYPDPNAPQPEPVFQTPLTTQISDLKSQLATAQDAIDFLLMGGM